MYESGKTVVEIATETGVHPKTIRRHLRSQGVEVTNLRQVSRQPPALSDEELRRRHAAGETYKELAAVCGVSPTLIWRRVNFDYPAARG
jgi:predicted transcriptional regulator